MLPALTAVAQGIAIGAAVAAPVGPMSLLCMRRTLALGWSFGFSTGVGIAAGDGLYALVAAFGLAGVMRFMVAHERPLHVVAGLFLLYLGWRTFFAGDRETPRALSGTASAGGAFGSALLLTLTNPPTIVSFVAIFTAFVPAGFDRTAALALVAGVFFGSLLWWLGITLAVSVARHVFEARMRRAIDRLSGAVLGVLGAAEIRRAI